LIALYSHDIQMTMQIVIALAKIKKSTHKTSSQNSHKENFRQ